MENIKYEISETNRNKKQIIIDRKYKFNFSYQKVDNSKLYRCTHYKTDKNCKSYVILNNKNKIIKYYNNHNHRQEDYNANKSLLKHEINESIRNNEFYLYMNPILLFIKNSQKIGNFDFNYNSFRTYIRRTMNKQHPTNIKTFDEIPDESKYFKTVNDEDFMIFKNSDMVIFQSPFQAKIYSKYHEDIFADGTFSIVPKFGYQVFITRNYVKEHNCFYTTSISILKDKKQATYEVLLKEINKNACKYNNNIIISPIKFHCDFERGISNAAKKIFPNIKIRLCIWHFKRALETNLCNEIKYGTDLYEEYKAISNFPFINPEYIAEVFFKIKNECKGKQFFDQFLKFLKYFQDTYIIKYKINEWNYYNCIEHITNNSSESFNNYLNRLIPSNPNFYIFVGLIREEENVSFVKYNSKNKSNPNKKKKILSKTEKINNLIEKCKIMESDLIKKENNRNDIVDLWYECLKQLNTFDRNPNSNY